VGEDQPPVVEVAGGGERGGAEIGRLVGADQGHPGHHHGQHQEEAGEEAAGAGQPERLQPDPAPIHLVEQDVGDQVAAEGEEHTHAQQPAFGPTEFEVVEHHADDGDRAQPVEARHVALSALYRFRHRTILTLLRCARSQWRSPPSCRSRNGLGPPISGWRPKRPAGARRQRFVEAVRLRLEQAARRRLHPRRFHRPFRR
jgi:hypothetical protein